VPKPPKEIHKRILVGVEIESYSIDRSDYRIGRQLSRPRRGLSESGEHFTRDTSIGSEYNSRPFQTVREAFFLLKSGLRKYFRDLYRGRRRAKIPPIPLLVGGWTDRFAGTHLHVSVAAHLHDHIPFFVAVGANSPIWDKEVTGVEDNRFLKGEKMYFRATRRGKLTSVDTQELVYSPGRKRKPPTLELRVLDSNLPEFVVALACLVKAVALRWRAGKGILNKVRHPDYLRARREAAAKGVRARLPWGKEWLSVPKYLDRFVREHQPELQKMDIPDEIFDVLRLVKRGYNGSRLLREAVESARREHPQTWQRRFAKRYEQGLRILLSGNSLRDFTAELKVSLPPTENVWLGRRGADLAP
jgi:hypothetical protein